MFRTVECISLVLVILIIGSCSAFVFRNPSSGDKGDIYRKCANSVSDHGITSSEMAALIQECVANSLNKQGEKENV